MDKRYLKKKPEHIVARSYYDLKASRSIGLFLIVAGILSFLIPYFSTNGNEGKEVTPILYFSVCFIVGGITFLTPHYVYKKRPISQYTYNPIGIGMWSIVRSVFGLSFVYYFLYIFYALIPLDEETQYILYMIYFFFGIFTLVFGIRILRGFYKIINGFFIGTSRLKVESKSYYSKGEIVKGVIINPRIKDSQLKVTLRNLEESYSGSNKGKNASSNSYVTNIHTTSTIEAHPNTRSEYAFEVEIPEMGFPSVASVHNPTYWELDCEGVDSGYRALFRIGVK